MAPEDRGPRTDPATRRFRRRPSGVGVGSGEIGDWHLEDSEPVPDFTGAARIGWRTLWNETRLLIRWFGCKIRRREKSRVSDRLDSRKPTGLPCDQLLPELAELGIDPFGGSFSCLCFWRSCSRRPRVLSFLSFSTALNRRIRRNWTTSSSTSTGYDSSATRNPRSPRIRTSQSHRAWTQSLLSHPCLARPLNRSPSGPGDSSIVPRSTGAPARRERTDSRRISSPEILANGRPSPRAFLSGRNAA